MHSVFHIRNELLSSIIDNSQLIFPSEISRIWNQLPSWAHAESLNLFKHFVSLFFVQFGCILELATSYYVPPLHLHKLLLFKTLRGYQLGTPDAFRKTGLTIDSYYVDEISITYGNSPRMHIWIYANGLNLLDSRICNCPCSNGNTFDPPPFVGSDYYCESDNNDNTCCDYSNDRIHCGADSNVLVRRLPAVLITTCRGSTRHSVRPPQRTALTEKTLFSSG